MSYNSWTTNDLISDIELLGHVPESNSTFTPSKILRLAQFELQTPLTKQILSARGGYYLSYEDYTTESDGLYVIPSGAISGALANVELVQNQNIIQVNELSEPEQFNTQSPTSTTYGFFMRGNYVQILPVPNVGVTRLWHFKRTSNLVQNSACAQVTEIADTVLSVSTVPSTFAVGTSVDLLGDQPPFNVVGERTITNINGSDITIDTACDDLQVGDWIGLRGQTCVPQIPVEYRLILAQRVVVKIYELQGYMDKMKAAEAKLMEYEQQTLSLISPRVKSQTKICTPVNGGFMSGNPNRMTNFPASGRQ